jgi:MATE family multidrug resistance protein
MSDMNEKESPPPRLRLRGGMREILHLAFPLILSTSAMSIQEFVDRMFLTWYSPASIAAATPAGILHFALLSLFLGTAGYTSTFVAQYFGARRWGRIGPVLAQGLYVALIGGLAQLALVPLAPAIFTYIGHPEAVRILEIRYFRILCAGAFFPIAGSALAGFFSGRGRPWPVMAVHAAATAVNVLFNYALIFGNLGFPELGIRGAGISTVLSGCFAFVLFLTGSRGGRRARRFGVHGLLRFNRELFFRLLRFGLPNGGQFFLDMFGFTVFILLVGRLGTAELAATNIALNINMLAFMPMLGVGIAVSVLVGQYLGADDPGKAERSVYAGAAVSFIYMGIIAAAYLLIPGVFVSIFTARGDAAAYAAIAPTAVLLLRFVAAYSLFDTLNIVFASGIKGAGDTRFVVVYLLCLSVGGLIVPTYLALVVFRAGLTTAWVIVTVYISVMGFGFLIRFLGGRWKTMRVID